ncbi:MAG: hypothetical protein ACI8RZ_005695 [Myxococcota bacterium]|jgi:uncharacterized protein YjbI with pentapeptide repeats
MAESTDIEPSAAKSVAVIAAAINPWPTWRATAWSAAVGLVAAGGFSGFLLWSTDQSALEAITALGDIVLLLPSIAAAPSLWLIWTWRTIYRKQDLADVQAQLEWDKEKTRDGNELKKEQTAAELETARIAAKTASDRLDVEKAEKEALQEAAQKEAAFQREQAEQRLHSERFTKAAEMLSSENSAIQLAAIYSMERIAHDTEVYRRTVHDLLGAFVRENNTAEGLVSETTRAVLDVLINREPLRSSGWKIVLSGVNLHGASLSGADLSGASLSGANLCGAHLRGANLNKANLCGAKLGGANLSGANLLGANLSWADLGGADLNKADLRGANLSGAGLRGANLLGADLSGADLSGAILNKANLRRAILTEADLCGANLTEATHDDTTIWPDGFTPPTDI